MVVTMNNNKIMILIAAITMLLVIGIPTVVLVQKRHNEKLYNSMVLKINEAAKKCVDEEVCQDNKIFIKNLYDNNYLSKLVNPLTNEYISEDDYVIKKEGKYIFIENE